MVVRALVSYREDQALNPPAAASKLQQFRSLHFDCVFGRDSESCRSLVPGVYIRGGKKSHIV